MYYIEEQRDDMRSEVAMFKHYVNQLLSDFSIKITFSVIVTAITGFYGGLLWSFLALFCIDWVTGVSKSLYKGIPISSRRLRDSVIKLGAYMLLLTALIITSKFEKSFAPLITVTYYYFIFTELKSILENVQEMGVKVPYILIDLVKKKTYSKEDDSNKDNTNL